MRPFVPAALSAALAVVATAVPAAAQEEAATVASASSEEYEAYLADSDGRALYMFTPDSRGTAESPAASACYDACLEGWPPLLTDGQPKAEGAVQADLLGTFERRDGSTQVTYAGWPLYRYFRDQSEEFQTHGQSLQNHGGAWYLLRPDGTIIEDREF